jgi:hypothetical protein
MEAKDIHKEIQPIWPAFICGYPIYIYIYFDGKTAGGSLVQYKRTLH